METERAIELLHRLQDEQFDGIHGDERREALSMAVKALVEPNIGQKTIDCIIKRLNDEDRTTGDTIYRQQAIDAMKEHRALYCDNTPDTFSKLSYAEKSRVDELDMAIATLVNLPPAQPERKRGRWLPDNNCYYETRYICSECKLPFRVETFMMKPAWRFCPNCGVRMDGGEGDET